MRTAGATARRGVLATEIAALVAATAGDLVLGLRAPVDAGFAGVLTGFLAPAGSAMAVLSVLRRRFPRHVGVLGGAVAALSAISTAVALAAGTGRNQPVLTEVVAAGVLTAAACRRLPPVRAAGLAVALGAVMIAAPLLRYRTDAAEALLSVAAAAYWGACLGIGLILRDADGRQRAVLNRVRTHERLQLARELHDLVAHHVSGIVVRVQAARALTEARQDTEHAEVYREIEQAGGEALTAARRLVGMLRDTEHVPPAPDTALGDVVRAAAGDGAALDIAEELDQLDVPPQLGTTVHRVVLEALTNVRRHAPEATEVVVSARTEGGELVVEVRNDRVPVQPRASPGGGFGIAGMTERVTMLGGTLHAGPAPGQCWLVTARLPLGAEDQPFVLLSQGI